MLQVVIEQGLEKNKDTNENVKLLTMNPDYFLSAS